MKYQKLYNSLVSLLIISFIPGCEQKEWIPLFNGTDLENWTIECLPGDEDKNYWQVKEGYIECNSMGDADHGYVWLATEREFEDFHLRLEFQVFRSSGGNSGVQFRSRYDDSETARNGGWLNGPQADIHAPDPFRAGLIYDETEGVQRWIYPSLPDWEISPGQAPERALETKFVYFEDDPEAWNSMEVVCVKMLVKTIVNGNLVTEMDGEGVLNDDLHRIRNVGTKGCIALQLHVNDELKIRFRDIEIKEL